MSVNGHDKFCGSFDKYSNCPECQVKFELEEIERAIEKQKPKPKSKWELWAELKLWNKQTKEQRC